MTTDLEYNHKDLFRVEIWDRDLQVWRVLWFGGITVMNREIAKLKRNAAWFDPRVEPRIEAFKQPRGRMETLYWLNSLKLCKPFTDNNSRDLDEVKLT